MPRRKMQVPELFQFAEHGSSIKGFLTGKATQVIQGKTVGRYVIKFGGTLSIINGTVFLDDALSQVERGEFVEIVYVSDQVTQSGYGVRQFEVYTGVDEEVKDEE